MFDGFTLLCWITGLAVLYGCYRVAVWIPERTPVDAWCVDVDTVVDLQDAHDARMRREVRL